MRATSKTDLVVFGTFSMRTSETMKKLETGSLHLQTISSLSTKGEVFNWLLLRDYVNSKTVR